VILYVEMIQHIRFDLERAVQQSVAPGYYHLNPESTPRDPCPFNKVPSGTTCDYVHPSMNGVDDESMLFGLFREVVKPGLEALVRAPAVPVAVRPGLPPTSHKF
jgi:hypothetical protein